MHMAVQTITLAILVSSACIFGLNACIDDLNNYLDVGTYIVTQSALKDAPHRYETYVDRAEEELNAMEFEEDSDYDMGCRGRGGYRIYGDRVTKTVTLLENSLSIDITVNGFYIYAQFYVDVAVPLWYKHCEKCFVFFCCCDTMCDNDRIYASGIVATSANAHVIIDSTTGSISIVSTPTIDTSGIRYDHHECDAARTITKLVIALANVDIEGIIEETIQKVIDEEIAQIDTMITLPQTYSPYEGVNVTYFVSNIEFQPSEYAKIEIKGLLAVTDTTGNVRCYQPSENPVNPPNIWAQSPVVKNLENNNYNGSETLYLLNGLRLSGTVLNAIIWAAEVKGELTPSNAFEVLDSTMIFNVTWDAPRFKIGRNDSLEIEMRQSSINGSCYQTEYGRYDLSKVLQVAVFNLSGNGTISIQIDNNSTNGNEEEKEDTQMFILISIDNFNLDQVSPNLYYPPIPLPSAVIEQLMIKLLNATIPYLNDWLKVNAFQIPPDIAQFLPNPVSRIVHQTGNSGYAELLSWCACEDGSSLFKKCGFVCKSFTNPPTTYPTIEPTSPTSAPLIAENNTVTTDTDTNKDKNTVAASKLSQLDGLWVHLYSTMILFNASSPPTKHFTTFTPENASTSEENGVYNNTKPDSDGWDKNKCDITQTGTIASVVKIENTNGTCQTLPDSQQLISTTYHKYYSLDLATETIHLFCQQPSISTSNDSCLECKYSADIITLGECSLLEVEMGEIYNQNYNMMLLGYYSNDYVNNDTYTSRDDVDSNIDIKYSYDTPCIGGNHQYEHESNVVDILYDGTSNCDSSYLMIQNLGAFGECNVYQAELSGNRSQVYYSSLQSVTLNDKNGTRDSEIGSNSNTSSKTSTKTSDQYTLLLQCTKPKFQPSTVDNSTVVDVSACNNGNCETIFENMQYGICSGVTGTTFSHKIIFSSELEICGKQFKKKGKNKDKTADTGLILGVVFGVIGLIVVCILCWIFRVQLRKKLNTYCESMGKWFSDWFNRAFFAIYECFGLICLHPLPPMEIWQTFGCFIAFAVLLAQENIWRDHNPWGVFNSESFEKLGIDSSYLDVEKMNEMFDEWTQLGDEMTRVFWIIFLILGLSRLVLIKPVSYQLWTSVRIIVLLCYIISQFGLFIVPSLFYFFKDSVSINPDSLEDNELISEDMVNNLNYLLGGSFAGIFITYLANVLLYWMHSIPAAGYCMAVFFVFRQLNPEQEVQRALYEQSIKMSSGNLEERECAKNFCNFAHACKYDLDESFKIAIMCRLLVMIFIVQALNSSIEALPVIILYQSFGVSYTWMTVWFFWWVIPVVLFLHFRYVIRKYIDILMHPNRYYFPEWKPATARDRRMTIDTTQTEYIENGKNRLKAKAWSIKIFRINVAVNVVLYFVIFWINSVWAFEIERSYVDNLDLTFLFWLVFGTFVMVLLLMFSLLHSMFVKYDQSGLHSKPDDGTNAKPDGPDPSPDIQIEIEPLKENNDDNSPVSNNIPVQNQPKNSIHKPKIPTKPRKVKTGPPPPPPRPPPVPRNISVGSASINSKSSSSSELQLKTISEQIADVPSTADQVKGEFTWIDENHCCYVFCLVNHWSFEKTERKYHKIFGKRVSKRRIFLIFGVATSFYANMNLLSDVINTSVKEYVIDLLVDLDIGVTWPDDENGGTIFDDAFELYQNARYVEVSLSCIALGFFIASVGWDACLRAPRGLFCSRLMGWIATIFLFAAAISTALPNYVSGTHIDDIMPQCAPQFDDAMNLMIGNLIGILCSTMFCVTMMPMLIALSPSIIRACVLVLKESNLFELKEYEMETLRYLIVLISILSPLITFLPLLVLQQLFGDTVTGALLCCFWILPVLMSLFGIYTKKIKHGDAYCCGLCANSCNSGGIISKFNCCKCSKNECAYKVLYMGWLMCYFGSLFAIVMYEFSLYGVPNYVVSLFTDANFYTSVFAEGFLANVVLSDFIYASLLTVDWDNLDG